MVNNSENHKITVFMGNYMGILFGDMGSIS